MYWVLAMCISFSFHNKPMRLMLVLSLFYRWGNWDSEHWRPSFCYLSCNSSFPFEHCCPLRVKCAYIICFGNKIWVEVIHVTSRWKLEWMHNSPCPLSLCLSDVPDSENCICLYPGIRMTRSTAPPIISWTGSNMQERKLYCIKPPGFGCCCSLLLLLAHHN